MLDPTKLIPEEILPPIPVGRLVLDRMPDNFFAETEQVAFMTQNVPPGIDFSNDPLLQGRNFSYLDTQLKRLGSPNFTHIPINAPKCPFHHFQQDGHMAMRNPVGHVNYQPNSFGEGPRESPQRGFTPFAEVEQGPKRRLRAESFADHYSQARQFFISQTDGEQQHIAAALTFELSKVKTPVIRERMVSHLLNIDKTLASNVAAALGLKAMPKPADAAMPTRQDLEAAPTLSIVENGPQRFEGRKLGILVTDGTDAALLKALKAALKKAGATFEIIAPKVGGAKASDGSWIEADQMIDGGPSVLYDAVALLPAEAAMDDLVQELTARDFVADAFAHCKFIGYVAAVMPLFEKAGIADSLDEGCIALKSSKDVDRLYRHAWTVASLGSRAERENEMRPANWSRRRGARELHINLAQPVRHRARLAVRHGLPVDGHDRLHEQGRAGDEGFLCRQRFGYRKRPLLDAKLALFGELHHRLAGAARQDRAGIFPRHQHVVLGQDERRRRSAFGDLAVLDHPGLLTARFRGRLLGQHLRQQRHALDVAPRPADVRHGFHRDAGLCRSRADDILHRR